jgi:serine/threonine protein kinase
MQLTSQSITITNTADFGFCALIATEDHKKISIVGTPYFMAPEMLSVNGGYGTKVLPEWILKGD